MIVKINGQLVAAGPVDAAIDGLRAQAQDMAVEFMLGVLGAAREILVDMSYGAALIGGGGCLLFWVAGWRDGKRWAGILIVAYVLIRYLFGGGVL